MANNSDKVGKAFDRLKEAVKTEGADAGKEFLFGMFVEVNHAAIADAFREWLNRYTLEDFRDMIVQQRMPDVPPDYFTAVSSFARYLAKYSEEDIFEFIVDANIDLAKLINSYGEQGHLYVVKLRQQLLEYVRHPDKAKAVEAPAKPPDTVIITCDKCGKSFPVAKDKVAGLKECPLCHAPANS